MLILSDVYDNAMRKIVFYVGIVEDDFGLRDTLNSFFSLRDDFKVLFSAGKLSGLLESKIVSKLDYLILDEHLEDGSGSAMMGKLMKLNPDVKIIFISGDENQQLMMSVLKAGAASFIYKPFSLHDIANSFIGIIENGTFLKPTVITKLLEIIADHASGTEGNSIKKLTAKEKKVADHIVDGKTYREIGQLLSVSVHAINHHTKNIYAKLGVSSRHQLVNKIGQRSYTS